MVFLEVAPGGEALYRQATQADNLFRGFFDELPSDDEFPPGDVSLLTRFHDFVHPRKILIGGNSRVLGYELIEVVFC